MKFGWATPLVAGEDTFAARAIRRARCQTAVLRQAYNPFQASQWRFRRSVLGLLVAIFMPILRVRAEDNLDASFEKHVRPFIRAYCLSCHDADKMISGVRVDQLSSKLEERHLKLWEHIQRQVGEESMPPQDEAKQPTLDERRAMDGWIKEALRIARTRPGPKNGNARRLTVAQYRNTLQELLLFDEDVADVLPPDAVSKDGFVNNRGTLAMSPLQLEAYLDIADQALSRCLVDESKKPVIQRFRMDLGKGINHDPCPDRLILGARSELLNNEDFIVTELDAEKPFPFQPFRMKTDFRFIEGYIGNGTIREWKDFHGIYHAVFACVRGTGGYPKGLAVSAVPDGLLLRPAIPAPGTYGPKANFKISLRELPDDGRFRVTVHAATYRDGLLLDSNDRPRSEEAAISSASREGEETAGRIERIVPRGEEEIVFEKPGIYQVDVYASERITNRVPPDGSRLEEGLLGSWSLDGSTRAVSNPALEGRLIGNAKFSRTPFDDGLSIEGSDDAFVVTRNPRIDIGDRDFTVAAWIRPSKLAKGGIISAGKQNRTFGWCFRIESEKGNMRFEATDHLNSYAGTINSRSGSILANKWNHVAVVVRREGVSQIFVNGLAEGKGEVLKTSLDNPAVDFQIGNTDEANGYRGDIDEVRLYSRALDESELQALVEPGRTLIPKSPDREESRDLSLKLGDRYFTGALRRPAFLAVRIPAGPLAMQVEYAGQRTIEKIVFTLLNDNDSLSQRFSTFEQRSPRIGVHVGLRRDCGTTMAPVGTPQTVTSDSISPFVFEGAIRNYPSPEVEKENVNYLAGIREIGVRSEYTDGRDMPRVLMQSIEFEGPLYDAWPPASHRNLIPSARPDETLEQHAHRAICDFATRAYRRPLDTHEEADLFSVFTRSQQEGRSFVESLKDVFQVTLSAPQFLFLIEHSETPEAERIGDYELASKLSYFLWNGPPDETLLRRAADGLLQSELNQQIDRMIADEKLKRFTSEFVSQWLALDKFQVVEPDAKQFPELNRDVRPHLEKEPIHFVHHLIKENLPIKDLIISDFVLANEVVATYYELDNKPDSGLEYVPIVHRRPELGGILSQAAIMSGLSDGRESNPIKRGAWMARRVIAEPPDDPPPNIPALKEETAGLSLRERLFQHRDQRGCAQCHGKIDPWGIPFEGFDAGGRLKEGNVDAGSRLPDGTEVDDFYGLRSYLIDKRLDQVAFSFLKHLTTYAVGRDLTYNELDYLRTRSKELEANEYRLQDMIRFVILSPMFLEK
jgi:hypothetical protein